MTTQTRQAGHPTLTLQDIAPSRSPALSPNLHKWMRKHDHWFRDGACVDVHQFLHVPKLKPSHLNARIASRRTGAISSRLTLRIN